MYVLKQKVVCVDEASVCLPPVNCVQTSAFNPDPGSVWSFLSITVFPLNVSWRGKGHEHRFEL